MCSTGAFVDVRAAKAVSIKASEALAAVASIVVHAFCVFVARVRACRTFINVNTGLTVATVAFATLAVVTA